MDKHRFRGFTLIELLVVIAIIGVLSAVVLASLNTARNKGNDAAIQSNMGTVRVQAEVYYGSTGGNSYGATNQVWKSGASSECKEGMFGDTTITRALAEADKINGNGNVACAANGTSYVAAAALNTSSYWCIDSTGAGKVVTAAFPGATVAEVTAGGVTVTGGIASTYQCP